MLSEKEQSLLTDLLQNLPLADILAVASTVSHQNLKPNSVDEAVKIILQHASCTRHVLERKKVTKSYLYQYLHKKNVSLPDNLDKQYLVEKTLELWSTSNDDVLPSKNNLQTNELELVIADNNYYLELAYKFTQWFYDLLNDTDISKLKTDHFYNDCYTKVIIRQGSSVAESADVTGSSDGIQLITEIKLKYQLYFAPNLSSNGIVGKQEPHGQVMVLVNGTLHKNKSEMVGIFEQIFVLVRDPMANNNWKIRNTQLRLTAQNMPSSVIT